MTKTTTGKLPKQIEYKEAYGPIEDYLAYCEMVKRVSLINPEAALLLTQQWEMPDGFVYSGDLAECFVWSGHHKGGRYWSRLYDDLGGWRDE